MLIEINEREAILIRAACHTEYMNYKYGKHRKYIPAKKADSIAKEYWDLDDKITEAEYKEEEE